MSPGLQLTRNISSALAALQFSGVSAHDDGEAKPLPRIVAALDVSTRLDGLPGLYETTGRIELQVSPDDATRQEREQMQSALWNAVADIESFSQKISTNLRLYLWRVDGESVTEEDPLFTYSIAFSARISLEPPL